MSKRSKHPNKVIEEAIKFAENQGWAIKVNEKGHAGVDCFAQAEIVGTVSFLCGQHLV